MSTLFVTEVRRRTARFLKTRSPREVLNGATGAIDLASIMVGVIVLGVIGGIIAASVFAVIPWSQDSAAKGDLEAVRVAENVAYGFGAEDGTQKYFTLPELIADGFIPAKASLGVGVGENQQCYAVVSQSLTGKRFTLSNSNPSVQELPETPTDLSCLDADGWATLLAGLPAVGNTNAGGPAANTGSRMVFTVDASLGGGSCQSFGLPVHDIDNAVTVNWGDGSPAEQVSSDGSGHTFAGNGTYNVTVDGVFGGFGDWNGSPECITAVTEWGDGTGTTNLSYAFYDSPVTVLAEVPAGVTNMEGMFSYATSFNQALDIDTSQVTNMREMFDGAESFNQPVTFDTSNVTTMRAMFRSAEAFDQPLSFDTSSVNTMQDMFRGAYAFDQPLGFDTASVTSMESMFYGADAFNSPVNFTDTSGVTTMQSMFAQADAFNQPVSFDTSNVWTMISMFSGATAFNGDINFTGAGTSNVTRMDSMFSQASSFNKPLNLDTGDVTNMRNMFNGASIFDQNVSGWDVSKVTNHAGFRTNSALSTANTPMPFR